MTLHSKRRVGLLGGTFDPIQLAHMIIANEAWARLDLERVIFVPAGGPWRKEGRKVSLVEHRVAMVRLAIADNPNFEMSLVEVERPGPSYTAETLLEMQGFLGEGVDMFFILGADALYDLPQWKTPELIVERCHLVTAARPGVSWRRLESIKRRLPGLESKLILLDAPRLDVSSSEIRRRVAARLPIRYLVPPAVEDYIEGHGLYKDRAY